MNIDCWSNLLCTPVKCVNVIIGHELSAEPSPNIGQRVSNGQFRPQRRLRSGIPAWVSDNVGEGRKVPACKCWECRFLQCTIRERSVQAVDWPWSHQSSGSPPECLVEQSHCQQVEYATGAVSDPDCLCNVQGYKTHRNSELDLRWQVDRPPGCDVWHCVCISECSRRPGHPVLSVQLAPNHSSCCSTARSYRHTWGPADAVHAAVEDTRGHGKAPT